MKYREVWAVDAITLFSQLELDSTDCSMQVLEKLYSFM